MNKADVICKLHQIADDCLLGAGNWPADRVSMAAYNEMIRSQGLEEEVPDGLGTIRTTALGLELRVELFTVFAGAWELYEVHYMLENYGYIDEAQVDELNELCTDRPDEFERKLRWHVREAYLQFCNRSHLRN